MWREIWERIVKLIEDHKSLWKTAKAGLLVVIAFTVDGFLGSPWAAITVGGIIVGIYNWLKHNW